MHGPVGAEHSHVCSIVLAHSESEYRMRLRAGVVRGGLQRANQVMYDQLYFHKIPTHKKKNLN